MKFYRAVFGSLGIFLLSEVIVELISSAVTRNPNVMANEIEAGFIAILMAILWRCK